MRIMGMPEGLACTAFAPTSIPGEIPTPGCSSARPPPRLHRCADSSAIRRGHAAGGRSRARGVLLAAAQGFPDPGRSRRMGGDAFVADDGFLFVPVGPDRLPRLEPDRVCRSEEHTSELQSHVNLVCRLLLEKKK